MQFKTLSIALATSLLASSAFASTLTSGPSYTLGANPPAQTLVATSDKVSFTDFFDVAENTVSFTFNAVKDTDISGFVVSATNEVSDISLLQFTLVDNLTNTVIFATDTFDAGEYTVGPINSFAATFLPDFAMLAGASYSLVWELNSATDVDDSVIINASFDYATVPVPASMPLLLTALGGAAIVARRARKA